MGRTLCSTSVGNGCVPSRSDSQRHMLWWLLSISTNAESSVVHAGEGRPPESRRDGSGSGQVKQIGISRFTRDLHQVSMWMLSGFSNSTAHAGLPGSGCHADVDCRCEVG